MVSLAGFEVGPDVGAEVLTPSEAYEAAGSPTGGHERPRRLVPAGIEAGDGLKDDLLVELWGIEPQASSMRPRRSTN